jgi:hypothetical protein
MLVAAGLRSTGILGMTSFFRSSSHLTMDPSCANNISDLVQSKFEWKQDKLVANVSLVCYPLYIEPLVA